MALPTIALASTVALAFSPATTPTATVEDALKRVADRMQTKYNMALAAAYVSKDVEVAVASGFTDEGLAMGSASRKALPNDLYVWGSTTKMCSDRCLTAPAPPHRGRHAVV